VSCTADVLARLGLSVEAELKPRLGGLFGGVVRAYLPQTWVFRTEEDAASLTVDATGRASVSRTALPGPDVTVEVPHSELAAALAPGGRRGPPSPKVKVTAHTAKGRAAFDYLRPRLGL
jgi:hypothetical protein